MSKSRREYRNLRNRHESTFSDNDWDVLITFWYPVAFSTEITGRPLKRRLLDVDLLLVRYQDEPVVVLDRCPHRGAMLSQGRFEGGVFECAYHGIQFGVDGQCLRVPSAPPEFQPPSNLRLYCARSKERYGFVWVCLDPSSERKLPVWPDLAHGTFQRVEMQLELKTGAGRHIENFCDTAHFSLAHLGTFGSAEHSQVPPYDLESAAPYDLRFRVMTYLKASGRPNSREEDVREVLSHYVVKLPYLAQLKEQLGGDRIRCIYDFLCPVTAETCRMLMVMTRNFDYEEPVENWIRYQEIVNEEDRVIVEGQRPLELPVRESSEVHVPTDKFSLEYRRKLKELGMEGGC